MRRSIVLFSLLVAVPAMISVLATASPAGAQRLSPRVCPQIIPCCPLPVDSTPSSADPPAVCCPQSGSTACCPQSGSTACCPSGTCCTPTACPSGAVTIGSSPNPSTAGRRVVISGVLTASPAAGVQVVLWRELAGEPSFQQLAQSTTDSSGHYSFTVTGRTVMADQAWYVTSGALRSGEVEQQVRALVGLAPSTHTAMAGKTIVLRGRVTPSHAGDAVLIEQRRGGSWDVIGHPRLSKSSSYSLSRRFAGPGKRELRAVLLLDARNVMSTSPTVSVTVKP